MLSAIIKSARIENSKTIYEIIPFEMIMNLHTHGHKTNGNGNRAPKDALRRNRGFNRSSGDEARKDLFLQTSNYKVATNITV